jgi:uncharacterized membrane protein YqhA
MMQRDKIENSMSRLRYISLIAIISSGLGSILMFVIGAIKTGRAYLAYFSGGVTHEPDVSANLAITYMIQAVDVFLIGLVLLIFSGGVYNLFIHRVSSNSETIKSWIRISNISQLKRILAELVIVILFVKFLEGGLKIGLSDYSWEMIVLPLGILMLALALKFMELNKPDN